MFADNALVLGIVAGGTIFLGLPLALAGSRHSRVKGLMNAIAVGILLFLLGEVVLQGWGPVEAAARAAAFDRAAFLGLVYMVGLFAGLLSLVFFERRFLHAGAASDPRALALMIAIGIGLHNFSEGLAIGASAAAGLRLALVLAIGFALHNATEGFGIAAPLNGTRPSAAFLALLGIVGGGPTFVGAILGHAVASPAMSVLFLSLAGGALIYVVKELLYHGRKLAAPADSALVMGGVALGLLLGLATDLVVTLGGA
ncbi:MAG: ZIP family metal transporter [Thermoplasmatota archaeon]